jgi:YfiH family protein
MQLYRSKHLSIFFGDSQHSFIPATYKGFSIVSKPPFNTLHRTLNLKQLVFLHQTHSTIGKIIKPSDVEHSLPSFVHEGDFLITQVPRIGLGVATADCLPIIFFDTEHKAVGIVHAGWKGSVASITQQLIERMKCEYGTAVKDIEVFFGPSAQPCCYEVQEDFLNYIESFSCAPHVIEKREDKLYFDLGKFNRFQLEELGIQKEAINESYHQCTMCKPGFCSARLQKGGTVRQMTVVSLN